MLATLGSRYGLSLDDWVVGIGAGIGSRACCPPSAARLNYNLPPLISGLEWLVCWPMDEILERVSMFSCKMKLDAKSSSKDLRRLVQIRIILSFDHANF